MDRPVHARPESALGEMVTVEYTYRRGELRPVLQAIRGAVGCGAGRIDTPDRLERALAVLIRSVGGSGDATVRRRAAALLSPEFWQIRLDATDERTLAVLADVVGRHAHG